MEGSEETFLKAPCPHCGGRMEYSVVLAGNEIACPHCQLSFVLPARPDFEVEHSPESAVDGARGLNPADLLGAFRGRMSHRLPPLAYSLGLVLVAVGMLLLPLLYLGLVTGAIWLWGRFAFGFFAWANQFTGGANLLILKGLFYAFALIVGGIVTLFLVKPLFARRARAAPSLALSPTAEPVFFAFVALLSEALGARRPARIDVDCRLNASAGFRRGWASLFLGGDLVLTVGLPLIACLDTRQLGGVLAHEMGHFRQGFGLRLSYLIRGVNAWLARVAYERDAWDEALDRWVMAGTGVRTHVVASTAAFGVWISRGLLKCLMYLGHGVSGFLLRQMEFDADRCEIEFAGSAAFETTFRRLFVLGQVARDFYRQIRVGWNLNQRLPEDVPSALAAAEAALSPEQRERLRHKQEHQESDWLSTHPPDAERIERARQAQAPGMVQWDRPASDLLDRFDVLARQVTLLHYEDDLGLPRERIRLYGNAEGPQNWR